MIFSNSVPASLIEDRISDHSTVMADQQSTYDLPTIDMTAITSEATIKPLNLAVSSKQCKFSSHVVAPHNNNSRGYLARADTISQSSNAANETPCVSSSQLSPKQADSTTTLPLIDKKSIVYGLTTIDITAVYDEANIRPPFLTISLKNCNNKNS